MDFFHSVPMPIRGSAPFCCRLLKKLCIKALSALCVFIVVFSIPSLIRSIDFRALVAQCMLLLLPAVMTITIFVESYLKSDKLKSFASKIHCIDAIMQQDLNINMKIDVERSELRWRFLRWNFISISILVCFFISCPPANYTGRDASRSLVLLEYFVAVIMFFGPFVIVIQLHFYRVVTFVEVVRRRYHLINACIIGFHNFDGIEFLEKNDDVRRFLNTDQSLKNLRNIRRTCQLLYSASQSINDLFGWSLFLCIFQSLAVFSVIIFTILCSNYDERARNIVMALNIPYLNNVISLATACEFATQEVSIFF